MCIAIENKSGKFTKSVIKNDKLREYANEIADVVADGRKARIQLCGIMAEMAEQDIFEETEGFGNFCENKLGIKKTQGYDMVRVGAVFAIKRANGWKPALTAKGGAWNQTQLMALLPMGGTGKTKVSPEETLANCEALVERGWLKPSMTVSEIKELVATERPDRYRLEAQKQKRLEAKEAKEKAEAEAAEKAEAEAAVLKGNRLSKVEIWQLSGGEIYVTFNGEELTFNDANISEITANLLMARNYRIDTKN